MKPLFSSSAAPEGVPLFAYGQLMQGQPLAWAMGREVPIQARVRGQLWRLPSGGVLLSIDAQAGWVLGELHLDPAARTLQVLPDLLVAPGIQPSFERLRARVGMRALFVQAWAAPAQELRQAGAHPLRSGNWRRVAPR